MPRGLLSMAVINVLTERAPRFRLDRIEASIGDTDPFGIDLQLSLSVCCTCAHVLRMRS
jgi:hypothetical protein